MATLMITFFGLVGAIVSTGLVVLLAHRANQWRVYGEAAAIRAREIEARHRAMEEQDRERHRASTYALGQPLAPRQPPQVTQAEIEEMRQGSGNDLCSHIGTKVDVVVAGQVVNWICTECGADRLTLEEPHEPRPETVTDEQAGYAPGTDQPICRECGVNIDDYDLGWCEDCADVRAKSPQE